MRLSTQLRLAFAAILALVAAITVVAWARQLEEIVAADARDEAAALATALAGAHASNVSQRNDALLQLDLEALAARVPEDIAYLVATDARRGDRVIAAVPRDLVGAIIPDVVPLAVTRAGHDRTGATVTSTFLLREGAGEAVAGDPVIDATEDVRSRDGTALGSLRVGIRYSRREALFRRAMTQALVAAGGVLVVGLVLAALLSRRVAAPIAALRARMAGVADGKLDEHTVPRGPMEIRELAKAYNGMVLGLRQKRALERYVPAGARKEIEGRTSATGIVESRRERVVILFADLRGFSTLSEKTAPADVLAILNEYSDAMSEIVSANGGEVNELLGDAVLAVFPGPGSAKSAVMAAKKMQERMRTVASGSLRMGVGLHMGDVVLGTVGTGERLKFAVVGDAVNVAARIQERSKTAEATAVFASDAVKDGAGAEVAWLDRGTMAVRGREAAVHLWEVKEL